MATATNSPKSKLVLQLSKLHPDYTISIFAPINEIYPYMRVTNGKLEVATQIRLSEIYWTVSNINHLVKKSVKAIERMTNEKS